MHIKELVKQFKEILSSAAFAETGESDTAIKVLRGRRKVLLVLTGEETDMKAARYAFNICKRIRIGIEILYVTRNNNEISFLEAYLNELQAKGIEYQVTQCEASLKEEIIRFIAKDKSVQFVVLDSQDLGMNSTADKPKTSKIWESLNCPLVLVSELSKT
jgi:hypothetical protein